MKKNFITFSILFIFFLMLAKMNITKEYALKGLILWLYTILPTLLPYTIISSLLLCTNSFSKPFSIIKKISKITFNENISLILMCGIFCGCPVAAKLTNDAYKTYKIDKRMATFLICAFNNLSPAFVINFALPSYLSINMRISIFALIIISNIISGYITIMYFHIPSTYISINNSSCRNNSATSPQDNHFMDIFENCILSSLVIQGKIGGYITIFSCISGLFIQTLHLSPYFALIFNSTLEISSGLGTYNDFPIFPHYIALISSLTSFGGICTICQIFSCMKDLDLPKSFLIYSKVFSSLLTYVVIFFIIFY